MKKKEKHSFKGLRKALVETAQRMSFSGLSPGRSGNLSCRVKGGMLITPSGFSYQEMKPSSLVFVKEDGSFSKDQLSPSTEWHFHNAIYQARSDIGAIVHTHSMHATVLACAEKSIPAFHYMVAVAGGSEIPLVPYAPFGTEELAVIVANGLRIHNACLLSHHGQVAIGDNLHAALELAHEVEVLAEQYIKVLALGSPKLLSESDMKIVLEKFKTYGRNVSQIIKEK
ncbi:MAG: class II aldolase/adducin family protein [Hyphomicrobium sp.]